MIIVKVSLADCLVGELHTLQNISLQCWRFYL